MEPDPTRCRRRLSIVRRLTLLCVPLACAAVPIGAFAKATGSLALGRQYTRMFYERQFEQLWAAMSDNMRKEQGSVGNLSGFRQTVQDLVGRESRLLSEKVIREGEQEIFVRRVMYEKSTEPFDLKWTLDREGKITDFSIPLFACRRVQVPNQDPASAAV